MAKPQSIQCVKIAGSMGSLGPFSATTVNADDPIFASPSIPTLALWQLPFVIRRVNPSSLDNRHVT